MRQGAGTVSGASVAGGARRARNATRKAASSSGLELLERAGYVIRGVLYTTMGALALGVALGVGGTATDQSGSLVILTSGPFGRILLLAVAIGLGAYAIWGFVRAVFDPLKRGNDPPGIAERLGFAWSGVAYTALTLFALQLFAGINKSPSHDPTQSAISSILTHPGGQWAAAAIGGHSSIELVRFTLAGAAQVVTVTGVGGAEAYVYNLAEGPDGHLWTLLGNGYQASTGVSALVRDNRA